MRNFVFLFLSVTNWRFELVGQPSTAIHGCCFVLGKKTMWEYTSVFVRENGDGTNTWFRHWRDGVMRAGVGGPVGREIQILSAEMSAILPSVAQVH